MPWAFLPRFRATSGPRVQDQFPPQFPPRPPPEDPPRKREAQTALGMPREAARHISIQSEFPLVTVSLPIKDQDTVMFSEEETWTL